MGQERLNQQHDDALRQELLDEPRRLHGSTTRKPRGFGREHVQVVGRPDARRAGLFGALRHDERSWANEHLLSWSRSIYHRDKPLSSVEYARYSRVSMMMAS